ncbi:S8 family peptidase [Sinorhizobium meliloti]|uniref:S8 family peptidase n=1 Tax=Rhizobium meliloti TaxID=382 RepID=UPI000FD7CC62|nr:S8 family serine peptidase [Sinorhizobium meliloti]RVK27629.1 peptidase S8 [Sinorhizobium meliloti]
MTKTLRLDWVVVEKRRLTPTPTADTANGSHDTVLTALANTPATTRVEPMTVDKAAEATASRNVVGAATNMPLMLIRAKAPANPDPFSGSAWGVEAVRAHTSDCSGEGSTVAVLDTGIDASHPAFQGVELVQRNFTNGPDHDVDGHGTHCAGTIFGRDVDGKRIGIARGVRKALIGKVISGDNGGTSDTLVKAVLWAQSLGADVISMSLGMDFHGYRERLVTRNMLTPRQATSIALEAYRLNLEMFNKLSESILGTQGVMGGSVVVGAAGNESAMPDYTIAASPPSNFSEFISVAAVSPKTGGGYELATFSNVNAKLAAPGTRIWSAAPGGELVEMEGTSMAAPHAAGVACLWYEKLRRNGGNPDASAVIFELRQSALRLVPGIPAGLVHWGLVQAPQP